MSNPTVQQWDAILHRVGPRGSPAIIKGFAEALPDICARYQINTRARQAHFVAQVSHESDHFKTTVEYASGQAYEGRRDLGNTQRGDGRRFRGRGLIQLTGRFNYAAAEAEFKQPFLTNPELAAQFPWAALIAGWFWHTRRLNRHADANDVRAVTRAINGGFNGLNDRVAALGRARTALA
jgi:putative chitinase